jgi:hypothetical protein
MGDGSSHHLIYLLRKSRAYAYWLASSFFSVSSIQTPAKWTVLPTFRVGLSFLPAILHVNHLWKQPKFCWLYLYNVLYFFLYLVYHK